MHVRTLDERWFAPEQLSARQRMTPEGFLLCEAVPIARTGNLIYDASEVPIEGGPGGQVIIERNADEVFRAETIASFEGKPVTLSHPDDFVNPDNWRELSMGITQNVRRGEGIESDLMLADLLITDAEAIKLVRTPEPGAVGQPTKPLRQVSCGYDADYEQLAPGRGRQANIVGNHVALVERGRCGARCAIGDSDEMKTKDAKPQKRSFADRLRAAFMSKDAAAAEELAKEAETADADEEEEEESKPTKTGDSATLDKILKEMRGLNKRVGDMEAKAKTGDEEEEEETTDNVSEIESAKPNPDALGTTYTGDAAAEMTDLRSRAEILVPGFTFPTRDAKANTVDHICSCQRQALAKAMQTGDSKPFVEPFLMGREISTMTADQVATVFIGASELAKNRNNSISVRSSISTKDFGRAPLSVAEINQRNKEFWSGQDRK